MARKTELESLGSVLLRQANVRAPARQDADAPVRPRDWEQAVGSRIAARARPLRLDGGVLLIQASSATWAQELSMLSDAILSALQQRGVPVKSLRFRVGEVQPPARPPERAEPRRVPPPAPLPPAVQSGLEHVEDEELRDVIAKAAGRNLGWQEQREEDAERLADSKRATSARRAARSPRSAAPESVRPAPSGARAGGARRRKPGSS